MDLAQMDRELINIGGGAIRFVAAVLMRDLGFQRNSLRDPLDETAALTHGTNLFVM